MNRRDFLKTLSTGAVSAAVLPALDGCVGLDCGTSVPEFARGAQDMGPILGRAEIRRNAKLKGRFCSYFCDDAIWCLRDLTRQRPKSMFDHPFFAVLKEDIEKCLGGEYLIFSNHEQYFFKDYLAYQPEYADKIRLMCKTMRDNGYTFILMQDTVD